MKKFGVLIICILCLVLSSCSLAACSFLHEQTEDIHIIYTNDVASKIDKNFGYAGVKGYTEYVKSNNKYVALVDAGDFYDGDISTKSNGEYITQIMNVVGYDVATIGNQEFAIGLDALANNILEADFDFVSCNIKYVGDGKDILNGVKPYVIKNFGGVRVAFVGVTTPETLTENKQAYEAITVNGVPQYDFYGANDGQDLYEQIQKTVNKARKRAEYVILLAHLGSNSVTEGWSSKDVIMNTYGIDAVIDGHSHTPIEGEVVLNKNGEDVALTSTGEKLQNLGEMILHPDHTINTTLYQTVYEIDAGVKEMVESIFEEIGE